MAKKKEGGSMSRTIVVGDLHGNLEVCRYAINQGYADKVIFVGDYLDSFNRSAADQILCLSEVLAAISDAPENVQGLIGNHERSYLYDEVCSGWNREVNTMVRHMAEPAKELLQEYIFEQGYLITHAGVSAKLLEEKEMDLMQYLDNEEHTQIGMIRGGYDRVGGMYWCHFPNEFTPIDGVSQIFGHTHYRSKEDEPFRSMEGTGCINYNIDCLPQKEVINTIDPVAYVAVIENGLVRKENLFDL